MRPLRLRRHRREPPGAPALTPLPCAVPPLTDWEQLAEEIIAARAEPAPWPRRAAPAAPLPTTLGLAPQRPVAAPAGRGWCDRDPVVFGPFPDYQWADSLKEEP